MMKTLMVGAGAAAVLLAAAGVAAAQTDTTTDTSTDATTDTTEGGSNSTTPDSGDSGTDEEGNCDEGNGDEVPGGRRRHVAGPFGRMGGFAEALGLAPEQLRDELAAGKTIAEIAAEQGVDLEAVIQGMLDDVEARLRELTTRAFDADAFEQAPGGRTRGPFGGPHWPGEPPGDERDTAPPTEAPTEGTNA
jgi:hypothetical protein